MEMRQGVIGASSYKRENLEALQESEEKLIPQVELIIEVTYFKAAILLSS